jgi:hypothetical protein
MGIFDKAKDFVAEHDDEVENAIDKVADVVEKKAPGHTDQVEKAADKAKDFVDKLDSKPDVKKS